MSAGARSNGRASRKVLEGVRLGLARGGCEYSVDDQGSDGTVITTACLPCELVGTTSKMAITVSGVDYTYQCPFGHGAAEFAAAVMPRMNGSPLRPSEAYPVMFDDSGRGAPKLILPPAPSEPDDVLALCAWLSSVLQLDPCHPVSGVARYGRRGQDGHIIIERTGLPAKGFLRFEPAGLISSARRFTPALEWQLTQAGDGTPYGFKDDHCRRIAHVIRLIANNEHGLDDQEETASIVGVFTFKATPIEGCTTYGNSRQRFEAVMSLKSPDRYGEPRYLIDDQSGEFVIRTSDLQAAAREQTGTTLPHGWLDGRMGEIGWKRITISGYAEPGRQGRQGPHARCDAYRGHAPGTDDTSVNT